MKPRSIEPAPLAPERLLRRLQRMHREHLRGIRPALAHPPTRALRQRREALDAVFVAVLGVDALAGAEREAGAEQAHGLALLADQVHLDAVPLAIVDRAMGEGGKVEIAAELAVDPHQHIEIEASGDAGGIVISVVGEAVPPLSLGRD